MSEENIIISFNGIRYKIQKTENIDGVIEYQCIDEYGKFPVFIRTNEYNIYNYKIGDGLTEDEEWRCVHSRDKLIDDFVDECCEMDIVDGNDIVNNWTRSAEALLNYIGWGNF